MTYDQTNEPKAGDWVRFYQEGRLVIGKIEYVMVRAGGYVDLYTDKGCVKVDAVIEARRV